MNKAQRAYERRCKTREKWEDIAKAVGYPEWSGARKGAYRYAISLQLPIPPAKIISKSEMAYEDMIFGASILEVTIAHDFIAPWSLRGSLKQYAQNNNQPWPIETHPMYKPKIYLAKQAYKIRCKDRISWNKISYLVGFSDASSARVAAEEYAEKNNLPPPPGTLTQGERAYLEYCKIPNWKDVRLVIRRPPEYCRRAAYGWARKHNKPWPPIKK